MPLNLLDSSTWVTSVLNTPTGPITYWALAELGAYYEKNERDGNVIGTLLAVPWKDRIDWKKYALGTVKKFSSTYFDRVTPIPCPYANKDELYLMSVEKVGLHVGLDSGGKPVFATTDSLNNNYFTLPTSTYFPPRIVYRAVFGNFPYKIVNQSDFAAGILNEQRRFVIKERETRPRERRVPSFGFETDEASPVPIPEVGFVPFVDTEFTWTWVGVPEKDYPETAIKTCTLKVNNATFGFLEDGTYGRYSAGDILFVGMLAKLKPYRGPNSEWLFDLPYTLRWQYADGAGNGMQKIPRTPTSADDNRWVLVRAAGTSATPRYLYQTANLDTLFQPG